MNYFLVIIVLLWCVWSKTCNISEVCLLILPIKRWNICPFICVIFISFVNILQFSKYRSFYLLGLIIPMVYSFVAIVNEILFKFLSDRSLLVQKCNRFLYIDSVSYNLLNFFLISSNSLLLSL